MSPRVIRALYTGPSTRRLLEADHRSERRRGAEELKSLASRQGAALHKEAVKQTNALRAMASPGLGPVPRGVLFVVLDQHRRIVASRNPGVQTESRISPGDNFAKIRVDRKNRGRDRVNFVFTFQNTASSATSTMAVASRISSSDCSA